MKTLLVSLTGGEREFSFSDAAFTAQQSTEAVLLSFSITIASDIVPIGAESNSEAGAPIVGTSAAVAVGVQSFSEVGAPIAGGSSATAIGVESVSEVGTPASGVSQVSAIGVESASEIGAPDVNIAAVTPIGAESASQVGSPGVGASSAIAIGAESASEIGQPIVGTAATTAVDVESATEVGSPTVSLAGDTTAPTMTNDNYDEGTSTFTATLSEPADLHFLVDTTEPTTANDIILGTGLYKTVIAVGAGGSSEPMEFSSVPAGTHWLGVIPVDAAGNSDFAEAHVAEYTFTGPYLATGVESASEVGAPTVYLAEVTAVGVESTSEVGSPAVYITGVTAIGAESASEVGTASIVSGVWAYSGSVVTNLPANEGWEFTGSVIDTIPAAA